MTLPVFFTTTSYSTVWPTWPPSVWVVNDPLPAILWSFSIEKAGAAGATVTTTVLEVWVIGLPSPGGGAPVVLAEFECEPARDRRR